jgi:two-component system chemotaxis sensor kinase CheA
VEVTVSDDGGGIDVDKLAGKALAKGLVTLAALTEMDDARKAELIFLPGLSSRDVSTEISGMGVGMDAVAAWAKASGGKVEVSSRKDEGTRIVLRLPAGFSDRTV